MALHHHLHHHHHIEVIISIILISYHRPCCAVDVMAACYHVLYCIKVDQKPHPIPPAKTIQHSAKWNNEVDMAKHYFEREQKY